MNANRQRLQKIDGDLLTLEDASVWRVRSSSEGQVKLWSAPFDEVEVEPTLSSASVLTNHTKGESLPVTRVV